MSLEWPMFLTNVVYLTFHQEGQLNGLVCTGVCDLKGLGPLRCFLCSSSREKISWTKAKHSYSLGQWTHIYHSSGDCIPETSSITCWWGAFGEMRRQEGYIWDDYLKYMVWLCHLDLCIFWDLASRGDAQSWISISIRFLLTLQESFSILLQQIWGKDVPLRLE